MDLKYLLVVQQFVSLQCVCLMKLICIYVDYILAVVDPGGGGFKKQCSAKNVLCQYLYTI